MSELMEFIGREAEISFIEAQIKQTETRAVVFVHGEGGLGKTRLLQEIRKKYMDMDEFLTTNIIDFDDRTLHISGGIEIKIAEELGIDKQVEKLIHELRSRPVALAWQDKKQQEITTRLRDQFNHLSENRRILFFFDTIEKLGKDTLRKLLSLLSHFENGVFLFAGRPSVENSNVDISQLMQSSFDGNVTPIDLEPLNMDNSRKYLRAKLDELHNVKDERVENLLKLVDGRPILIELTAQWLSIAPAPDWLNELESLPDEGFLMDEDFRKKQKNFQAKLVNHITQLRIPLDQLLLVLSRVYPLDVEMIEELLRLSREQAEMLMGSAKEYVFVKTLPGEKITLHDEMRRMVNDLVWEDIDKSKEWRRRDSKKAAAIYERRVNNQANNQQNEGDVVRSTQYSETWRRIEQEVLEEHWVDHALYADANLGFDNSLAVWDKAIRGQELDFAKRMLEKAKSYFDEFTEERRDIYILSDARQKTFTGCTEDEAEDLRKRLRDLEQRHRNESDMLSTIYNIWGRVERKYGSMRKAVRLLSQNLKIIRVRIPGSVPLVANQLGYTYRLMGNLEMAGKYYRDGLYEAVGAEERNMDLIASLLNNLGYVYGLHRHYDIAENYCLQAADIWNNMDQISQVGRVDISLGIFQRDRGNYEKAIKLLNQAVELVSGSSNYEVIGLAYYHLAWSKWFEWEDRNNAAILDWGETKNTDDFIDIEMLMEAKDDFDRCLDIAENRGAAELLPGILHEMSYVYWWLGWLQDEQCKSKARKLNTKAYLESEKRDNIRYAIESLVGNAEFDYDTEEYSNISAYAEILEKKYGKVEEQYLLFFGRMTRISGDVAFLREKYEDALEHYTNALPKIQRHGGYGKYSTQIELLRLERKLDKLSISEVNMWLKHFQEHWKKRAELIHWCEKEQLRTRLRIKQRDYVES